MAELFHKHALFLFSKIAAFKKPALRQQQRFITNLLAFFSEFAT